MGGKATVSARELLSVWICGDAACGIPCHQCALQSLTISRIQCDTSHNAESHGWKLHAIHTSFFLVPNNATNDKVISSFSVIIARKKRKRHDYFYLFVCPYPSSGVLSQLCCSKQWPDTLCIYLLFCLCSINITRNMCTDGENYNDKDQQLYILDLMCKQ